MLNLNVQLADVDTSMPRLASGDQAIRIDSLEVVESKKTPGNFNLMTIFSTTEPAASTRGDVINPGYKLRRYYPLQQSETEGAPDFKRDLAVLIDAAMGTNQSDRPELNDETARLLIGRVVSARIKVSEDEVYGESNDIGMLKYIG